MCWVLNHNLNPKANGGVDQGTNEYNIPFLSMQCTG